MTYIPINMILGTIKASARQALNATGSTIYKGTPVRITAAGTIALVNPSIESEASSLVGLVKADTPHNQIADVIIAGTIEDISISANAGDVIYLSKSGGLTATKPSVGVAGFTQGDWAVRLGVLAKNQTNPLLKDLVVAIQVIGEL